jgi:hypothetical protein
MFEQRRFKPPVNASSQTARADAHPGRQFGHVAHGRAPRKPATTNAEPLDAVQEAKEESGEDMRPATQNPPAATWNFAALPIFPAETTRGLAAPARVLQPRLEIGAVDDPLEREADAVADRVMRMPEPALTLSSALPRISRKCATCEEEEKQVQMKPAGGARSIGAAPPIVHEVLRSPGRQLDVGTREFFERRFGRDFGDVRIHDDGVAAESARSVGALAYTVGRDIVFGKGAFATRADAGRRLLAHELVHTVQQGGAPSARRQSDVGIQAVLRAGPEPPSLKPSRIVPRPTEAGSVPAILQRAPDDDTSADQDHPAQPPVSDREQILEALRQGHATEFRARLKAVAHNMRFPLEADDAFLDELRRTLSPMSFWSARVLLHYGASVPSYVKNLRYAVEAPNLNLVKDLLRAFPQLQTEVPGTREMLDQALAGRPAGHDEVLAVFDQQVAATGKRDDKEEGKKEPRSVHYGVADRGEDPTQLTAHNTPAGYTVARTESELRIIVRIRLLDQWHGTYSLDEERQKIWLYGIETRWNGRFVADNTDNADNTKGQRGGTILKIIFVPVFTDVDADAHFEVAVLDVRPHGPAANSGAWWVGADGLVIAHEFGHLLGLPDEYGLPGSKADVPASQGLSKQEVAASTVEGIEGTAKPAIPGGYTEPGIMGGKRGYPNTVETRHVLPAVEWYNTNLKPTDEADYDVKRPG